MDTVREVGTAVVGKASVAAATILDTFWTEAPPEQQKLTVQLARNSFYFTAACILIRFFGDQVSL